MPLLKYIIREIRPYQWYKNGVIFVALIFAGKFMSPAHIFRSMIAFVLFCLLSGGVYIINDIVDIEEDRRHKIKKNRPIASGKLSVKEGYVIALNLILISISIGYLLSFRFFLSQIAYLLLNLFYTYVAKNHAIVDIIVISLGLVIRAIAGALAIDVRISPWLVNSTYLMAMLIALGKERYERKYMEKPKKIRAAHRHYSVSFIEKLISIVSSALIISYMLYTVLNDNRYMIITIPLVFAGIFRYLQIVFAGRFGERPEFILRDRFTQIVMVLWIFTSMVLIKIGGINLH